MTTAVVTRAEPMTVAATNVYQQSATGVRAVDDVTD